MNAAPARGGPSVFRGRDLLLLLAGFVVWSIAFLALYGGLSVGCFLGWNTVPFGPVTLDRALLLASWAVLTVSGVALLVLLPRGGARPFRRAAALGLLAAAFSTFWTGLPVLFATSACS